MKPILAMIVLVFVVLACFQLFCQLVYDCRLGKTSIEFVLFRSLSVWQVPYSDIAEIRPIARLAVFALRYLPFGFISRPAGRLVLLRRKTGLLLKVVLITPDKPEEFVVTVRKNLTNP